MKKHEDSKQESDSKVGGISKVSDLKVEEVPQKENSSRERRIIRRKRRR